MTGSEAERNLLGAVLSDNRQLREIFDLVSGRDFEDGRLGDVFEQIVRRVSGGERTDAVVVSDALAEWGIRGINHAEPFTWVGADVYPHLAADYARAVRNDAVRRGVENTAEVMRRMLFENHQPVDAASKGLVMLTDLVDGTSSGQLRTKLLSEVMEGDDSYDWVIDGLLERRDRLVITGGEGAGKTTFVRQLALLSAAGIHPLFFHPIEPVNVLVVDAENTEKQWRRAIRPLAGAAAQMGSVDPLSAINMVAGTRIDITQGSHLGEIHRLIDQHEPDVVFIGPLYKLVTGAITNDDDAAPLIVALDSLRDRGVALVMEAHAGHAKGVGGERDLRPRGSAALLGWPEFGFGLQKHEEDEHLARLVRWRGDREERGWPAYLRHGITWPWVPASDIDH
ncbi:hypothetical protein LLS1_18740 [Leifsonia sp. LS1]|nr:hypothetical protein LLS1_18740 [Leifsonia sp. LS1]